jgi:glutamate racemase
MGEQPVGVLDSGVGGLSVLRELLRQHPHEDYLYLADQAHVPYGSRTLQQVREYSESIVRFLIGRGAKLIVVACNTASAAALHPLRRTFPGTPFVGMEPAVKPAAQSSRSRSVGVLATPATFQGKLFASVVERFGQGVELIEVVLPGLVEQIEAGGLESAVTRRILEEGLSPLRSRGVDTLVLACTHYPFVIPLIRRLAGDGVEVIDPAPAIARQAGRLLAEIGSSAPGGAGGRVTLYSTGEAEELAEAAWKLIQLQAESHSLRWRGADLVPG